MNDTAQTMQQKYTFDDLASSIDSYQENYRLDVTGEQYFSFPLEAVLDTETRLMKENASSIAYFSMEFGLAPSIYNSFELSRPMNAMNHFYTHEVFSNYWLCDYLFKIHTDKMLDIPIYGGGLGVLAGDSIKSAADLGFSFVGLGILWNKGYFKQNFWYKHGQVPEELKWDPYSYPGLIPLKNIITIDTKEGPLYLRLWKYYVYSYDKKRACPLVLLDSNVEENSDHFKQLTDQLYRSDDVWWKIFQRVILGVGGMKAIANLGYKIDRYHLNEGHAAFALLEKYISLENKASIEEEKKKFVFTCHTPVAAGHDRFQIHDVEKILNQEYVDAAQIFGKESKESPLINLTFMALNNSSRMNAVAQRHGEVMRMQFPDFADKIDAITNGIHAHTWASDSFQELFDKYKGTLCDWRKDPSCLEKVQEFMHDDNFRRDIFEAHQVNKRNLVELLKNWRLKEDIFTLGWARRIAGYKRPGLILHNVDRIVSLAKEIGPIQIILAGKAHPTDDIGGAHIDRILDHIDTLNAYKDVIRVLILENYDTYFGKLLTSSVDVWLNNPLPPFEASGTSGMKAILNGVLQLSTLDGWMVEAAEDNIGWIFGYQHSGEDLGKETDSKMEEDSSALYDMLGKIMNLYYGTIKDGEVNTKSLWIDKMINCVRRSAFFNTQRMLLEYNEKMWKV